MSGSLFRWRFTDDAVGDQWSAWHVVDGACTACCCGGPRDGEHQEGAPRYDEYGIVGWSAHTYMDPSDVDDEWDTVEWREAAAT